MLEENFFRQVEAMKSAGDTVGFVYYYYENDIGKREVDGILVRVNNPLPAKDIAESYPDFIEWCEL